MYKKLGIIGGMGPLATYTLYKSLITLHKVQSDQEHLDMVILNDPKIPDRSQAILADGESPLPYIIEDCHICAAAGCDIIAIPCNTSHYYIDEIQQQSEIPVLNMVQLVAESLHQVKSQKAYLLATSGTIQAGIYSKALDSQGIELCIPDEQQRAFLMELIYAIKAGEYPDTTKLAALIHKVLESGFSHIILGCTELSLLVPDLLDKGISQDQLIDSTEVLAKAILERFDPLYAADSAS